MSWYRYFCLSPCKVAHQIQARFKNRSNNLIKDNVLIFKLLRLNQVIEDSFLCVWIWVDVWF